MDDTVSRIIDTLKILCDSTDALKDRIYSALHDAWYNNANYIELCIEGYSWGFNYLCIVYHVIFYKYPVELDLVDFYPAIIIHKDKELDREIEYILRNTIVIQSIRGVIRFYVGKHILKYLRRYRWDCSKVSYKVYTENPMGEVNG